MHTHAHTRTHTQFVMGELQGKTMGFFGLGDIAQHAASITKHAFGMRIVALRRQVSSQQIGERVEE